MNSSSAQKAFQSRVVLLIFMVILGWVLLEYTSLLYRSYQIEQKMQWFVEENVRLVDQNGDLEKRYEYYKTDYFFRKEAKRKLNKKEPGEKVLIVSGGEDGVLGKVSGEITMSNYQKWKDYFFSEEVLQRDFEM